ncbi:hypothetical protein DACRYDRAFT_16418 [Dacryopinax primogenitus]|uniref:Uncharacterized protein n=1 Tax=Dacryopinax primogenitus (strain DJM 731) TaxID=1858805 RepID=M5FX94_DACPD|nr:uncharacterized protein DACRYDRAFT_16418 [Dacryopinax primogenitus]EJU01064.1 hypothetical protein DACRYDRAFT_16418 [Dacryopinax primogenitus]
MASITDNDSASPSIVIDNVDSISLAPNSDWTMTINFLDNVKMVDAPLVDFLKSGGPAAAPAGLKDSKTVDEQANADLKGKGLAKPKKNKKKNGPAQRQGKKIILEVCKNEAEASNRKTLLLEEEVALVASHLLKVYKEKYQEAAGLCEGCLKEVFMGESKISLLISDGDPADSAPVAPKDADAKVEDSTTQGGRAGVAYQLCHERIEALVLAKLDKPKYFNKSSIMCFNLGTATPMEMLNEFHGMVQALKAINRQELEINGAVARARKAKMAVLLEQGKHVGFDKVINECKAEWKACPLEERKVVMEQHDLAEEHLGLKQKQHHSVEQHDILQKTKKAGKKFAWTYSGKILEIGATLAVMAILKKCGTKDPEKAVWEVFGLGKAMQAMDGVVEDDNRNGLQ